jgi:hypothetical protein
MVVYPIERKNTIEIEDNNILCALNTTKAATVARCFDFTAFQSILMGD